MTCPDCGGKLGTGAIKCRCGWGKKTSEEQALPAGHVQCSADISCRKPGRMKHNSLLPKERVCVDHYYAILDIYSEEK